MYHIRRKKFYTIHQFANDWLTVKEDPGAVFSPGAFIFTVEEFQKMRQDKGVGMFWAENEVVHDVKYIEFGGIRIRRIKRWKMKS